MKKALENISLADYYYGLLSNLNSEGKLDLISKLSQSLKKKDKEPVATLESLFGALKTDESAEELVQDLRAARTFKQHIA